MRLKSLKICRVGFDHLFYLDAFEDEMRGLLGITIICLTPLGVLGPTTRSILLEEKLEHAFEVAQGFTHGVGHVLPVLELSLSLIVLQRAWERKPSYDLS